MLAVALSMTGCAEFVYNSMHYKRVSECDSLHGQEREDCLVQAQKAYERYEVERDEAIKQAQAVQ
jgi:hypothetical protein